MTGTDRLLPSRIRGLLRTRRFGRRVYYYPETTSTNDVALGLARAGEPEGTLVVADHQSRGRGRLHHTWSSRTGEDLLFTLILRPASPPPQLLPITLVFASAVAAYLDGRLPGPVMVEWPNDLVTAGGKIGGILAEGAVSGPDNTFVVVGVGINVNSRADSFPDELTGRAASCRTLSGETWDRADLLAGVLEGMERDYGRFVGGGFAAMKREYESRLAFLGRTVSYSRGGKPVVAKVEGVEDDGALRVVSGEDGSVIRLYGEEVNATP